MIDRKADRALLIATLLIALIGFSLLLLPGLKGRGKRTFASYMPAPSEALAAEAGSWTEAVQKVKEERGEPVGRQAKVDVPAELKHYSDTRRFLAIQVAESLEHSLDNPQDFVDLAAAIKRGEMVELKPVSQNYILFGVGGLADREPFTRYENGKRVALLSEEELTAEYARIRESGQRLEGEIADFKQEMASLSRRERTTRARLQSQINEREKSLKALRERKEDLDATYGADERRQKLLADYEAMESFAHSFSGKSYSTTDPRSLREMKVRMLSHLRPEALKVLEEIAAAYRQKFGRPLPITSLVRPDEYQHMLGKTNPNATRIATPPHSTGLAFDILYKYMTAEEQAYLMSLLSELEDKGRIEVLRENRDHYHVFAFVDGARPEEDYIRRSLGHRPEKAQAEPETKEPVKAEARATAKKSKPVAKKPVERRARTRRR